MKFKNALLPLLLTLFSFVGTAQVFGDGPKYDPVQWSGAVEKNSDTEYILHYDAVIEKDWHVYSQFTPEGGPIPFRFEWIHKENGDYIPEGEALESPIEKKYSDIFEVDEWFWVDDARISQKIRLKDKDLSLVKSIIKYQTCLEAVSYTHLTLPTICSV